MAVLEAMTGWLCLQIHETEWLCLQVSFMKQFTMLQSDRLCCSNCLKIYPSQGYVEWLRYVNKPFPLKWLPNVTISNHELLRYLTKMLVGPLLLEFLSSMNIPDHKVLPWEKGLKDHTKQREFVLLNTGDRLPSRVVSGVIFFYLSH